MNFDTITSCEGLDSQLSKVGSGVWTADDQSEERGLNYEILKKNHETNSERKREEKKKREKREREMKFKLTKVELIIDLNLLLQE